MKLKNILDNILQIGIFILIVSILLIPDTSQYSYKLLTMQFVTAILLLILSIQIYRNGIRFSFNILLFPIFLYFFMIIYSYFISDYKNISFLVLTKRLTYLSAFFIIACSIQKDELLKMINVWIITATIVSVYGIVQYLGFDFFNLYKDWYKGCYRIFSTIGNANFLAGFLIITFPFLISSYFRTKSILAKLLISISGILLLICLAVTFSRSGYLVFIITILSFIFLFIIREKKKRYLWLSIVLILVLILSSILFFYTNFSLKHKLYPMLTRKTARIYIWQGAVDMIKEKPLNGFGLGTFVVNFPDFRPDKLLDFHPQNVAYIKHAHNYFLETWVESGIFGFISFMLLILIFLCFSLRLVFSKESRFYMKTLHISVVSSFLGVICMNLINVNMHYPVEGIFFWVLIAIIYILSMGKFDFKKYFLLKSKFVFSVLFILLSLLLFRAAVSSLCYVKKENRDFKLHKDRISKYFYNDQFKLAISNYKNMIKKDIANDKVYYNLGTIYFLNGNIKDAVINIEKAILKNPDDQRTKYLLYRLSK